jgi:hypothetical protein
MHVSLRVTALLAEAAAVRPSRLRQRLEPRRADGMIGSQGAPPALIRAASSAGVLALGTMPSSAKALDRRRLSQPTRASICLVLQCNRL